MAIYAEIHRYSGQSFGRVAQVIDMGSHVPVARPPIFYKDIDTYSPKPVQGEEWWYNNDSDLFTNIKPVIVRPPMPASVTRAPDLWFKRLTDQERSYVWAVCNGETPPGVTITLQNRYRLAAFKDITLTGLKFPLDHAEIVAVIDGMEAAGIIGAGRADEILER